MNEETKDCTRLPVAGYFFQHEETGLVQCVDAQQVEWGFEANNPRLVNMGAVVSLTDAKSLATDLRLELNAKRLKLCAALKERNDAQARLAEKDARIAQLAAHARGKNKALANALKEIERLKTISDNYCALLMDANQKLQAAPADRGMIAEVAELYCPEAYGFEGPETFPDCGTCVVCRAKSIMANGGLNPAPATADSDVREVSE